MDRKNTKTEIGQMSLGLVMSQAHRQVNISEQQPLPTAAATVSSVTHSDAQIRLPQHHQVAPIAPALTIPAHNLIATHQVHQLAHLQGLQNMQQHSFNVYRPQMPQEAMFKDKKLRSGKWTPEEEAYADILIELFVKGQVDLENGSTLRSFLAKKLHCAPMRVTKKYAGKSKGKASYLGKKNSVAIDPVGYQRNMTRLQTAKKNFLKAVYPEISVTHKTAPIGVAPQIQPLIVPLITNPAVGAASWPQYPFPTSNLAVAPSRTPYAGIVPKPTVEISSRPSIAVIGPGNQSLVHIHATHHPNTTSANTKSQSLQESFLKAVHSTSATQSKAASLSTVESQQTALLHNAYVTASEAVGIRPPSAVLPTATRTEQTTTQSIMNVPQRIPVGSRISNSATIHQATEMPDFLKGFDKVTGMKRASTPASTVTEHHTPTFTSKSFDDCHRLLGVNISPIAGSKTTDEHPANQSVPLLLEKDAMKSSSTEENRKIATPAQRVSHLQQRWSGDANKERQTTFGNSANPDLLSQTFSEAMSRASSKKQPAHHLGADYYNMFAQQTALAASQHSAYLGGPENEQGNASRSVPAMPMGKPVVVSEPPTTSGSDRCTEESDYMTGETTSGGSDTASTSANDSDGTNSESSRKRKKARTSRSSSAMRIDRVPENQTIPPDN